MFQAGLFSTTDHDDVSDLIKKPKRLQSLLEILERKHLHAHFLNVLETLQYTAVLETLQTDKQLELKPCKSTHLPFLLLNKTTIKTTLCLKVINATTLYAHMFYNYITL